jgi:hypothetical protein
MKPSFKNKYVKEALEISPHQIETLYSYYRDIFEIDQSIQLKFRFLKIFGLDTENKSVSWIRMDNYLNKRRIGNNNLKKNILELFDKGIVPIRIFHSASEWLSPDMVDYTKTFQERMIRSGFLILENDESLSISIKLANELNQILEGEKLFIYTGNVSIHTWYTSFNITDYFLEQPSESELWRNREKYDRIARIEALKRIQDKVSIPIDDRPAIDSRRVVPIINTLNGFTGRRVTRIANESLSALNSDTLKQETLIMNWIE